MHFDPVQMNQPLGFGVNALLPKARGGGALKMGLTALSQEDWLQPKPDLATRAAAFDAHPDAVCLTNQAKAPGEELAAMMGVRGGLADAARGAWEDMCLLQATQGEAVYRLIGAAVAFPTDWSPADKLGLPLSALHAPIHGYAEQLASGVDHFMAKLRPGRIFGRCNWFIAPTGALRWRENRPASEAFAGVDSGNAGERLFVRCERQTLRRLPQTGAIVFTIGIYVHPLAALTPQNCERMAQVIATIPQAEAQRRGSAHYAQAIKKWLENRSTTAAVLHS